jgi:hypothetical protein
MYEAESNSFCFMLHAGFLHGICFFPEDGGDIFHQDISELSADYTHETGLCMTTAVRTLDPKFLIMHSPFTLSLLAQIISMKK